MDNIVIRNDELKDPRIDELIQTEKAMRLESGEFIGDVKTPFFRNPVFYYTIACALGAFFCWLGMEPFLDDGSETGIPFLSDYMLFGAVAAALGLAMGMVYGISNHNLRDFFYCGFISMGVGILVTMVTTVIADIVFGLMIQLAFAGAHLEEGVWPTGFRFYMLVCGRAMGWSIVSAGAGLGLGVALKSKKLTVNGLTGGLVGGALGGLIFDPVGRWLLAPGAPADMSRMAGILAIGVFVGLFIGLFENMSKDAWFLMLRGPLAGKQFNIYRSPMVIGSAPKCNIYLFKDAGVDPHHASVIKTGSRYLLQDEKSRGGTHVNGKAIDKYVLRANDVVTIGQTVLRYHEKQR